MTDGWTPDIVVGVDFGMTCTGVAYSSGPNWPPPKPIQHWPGLIGSQIATKVPSHLLYTPSTLKWGFQCEETVSDTLSTSNTLSTSTSDTVAAKATDIIKYFKLNLDSDFTDSRPDAPSRDQAMCYFRDYIGCVYRYVVDYFSRSFPRFEGMKVEFVFSVPTTWKDPRMVEELRKCVEFDRGRDHRAVIGLTEAEAAAVYVSGLHYQKNDVILVCDAGGGTTDVNVLKLASTPGEPTVYDPLGFVEGKPVGSVFIDVSVQQLICTKLEPIKHSLPASTDEIAWQMMGSRFERFKCAFGMMGEELETLRLDLPASVTESDFPEQGIWNRQLLISRAEIKEIFDEKVTDLTQLLDDQVRNLQLTHPAQKISFLVLSGGFGSCPYLRNCIKERYETPTHLWPEGIKVLTVDEPQLAVVQGQVMNRTQQLRTHATVFNHLYSPVSYGVICDWIYDPRKHSGETTRFDERNMKTYAVNQIDWLVMKGDLVPRSGISKSFPRKISPRDLSQPFVAQIVMSQQPRDHLPRSMTQGDAKLICELEVDTTNVEKKIKNHHWYNRSPVYFLVNVIVKLLIEPAGLQFELWSANGDQIPARSRIARTDGNGAPLAAVGVGVGGVDSPITIWWESIAEKMQDGSGEERMSPGPRLQRGSNVPSEVGGDHAFEMMGDIGPPQQSPRDAKLRPPSYR